MLKKFDLKTGKLYEFQGYSGTLHNDKFVYDPIQIDRYCDLAYGDLAVVLELSPSFYSERIAMRVLTGTGLQGWILFSDHEWSLPSDG